MALLDIDGFAHGNTARYTAFNGVLAQSATPRVPGGYYASINGIGAFKRTIPASAEVFMGQGFRAAAWGSGVTIQIMSFFGDAGATQHITLGWNASGQIEVRRGAAGAGTILATGATVIPVNTWVYVEARVTISDTVGVVQVRLNGSSVNEINFTGDTKNGGTNSTIDAVTHAYYGSGSSTAMTSDVYICDTAGSTNNTWLGDVAVRTLTPSGDGNSSQLLGSDGNSVSNYLQADEVPYNTTDYNGSPTVAQKDTYAMSDLPAGVTAVKGVRVNAYMAKSDAGAASAKIVTRSGGTDFTPSTDVLTTTYVEYSQLKETDPATSAAWTAAGVNAVQVGMEVA